MSNLTAYALGVFSGGMVVALAFCIVARHLMHIGQEWLATRGERIS
jgi:hypothetical protein